MQKIHFQSVYIFC